MTPKVIITKPGYEATTDTNPDHMVFSSDYNTLKYYIQGSYQMSNVSTTQTVTIAHNLGYTPFFICYVQDYANSNSGYAMVEYLQEVSNAGVTIVRASRAYVDSTNLYLSQNFSNNSTNYTINWYYKIFRNNLNL